jgi:SAM-dependent methyltransferase
MPIMSRGEQAFCRSAPWNVLARRVVVPWVLRDTQLSGEVLEIGGGSGAMAALVADRYPGARFTITDLDQRMVEAARGRLGMRTNVVAVDQADVTELPFTGGQFDTVTSYLMLHHVIAWEDALAEAHRVLKPGGRLVGYDLLDRPVNRAIHRLDRSPFRLIRLRDLRRTLEQVGFESCQLMPGLAGHAVRFHARKPPINRS